LRRRNKEYKTIRERRTDRRRIKKNSPKKGIPHTNEN
jgi:hypothetical protein